MECLYFLKKGMEGRKMNAAESTKMRFILHMRQVHKYITFLTSAQDVNMCKVLRILDTFILIPSSDRILKIWSKVCPSSHESLVADVKNSIT
jgi:hypothetical protein